MHAYEQASSTLTPRRAHARTHTHTHTRTHTHTQTYAHWLCVLGDEHITTTTSKGGLSSATRRWEKPGLARTVRVRQLIDF